ncbi:MAG: hypothetical protein ACTSRE_08415 [Promethearchaeota archaeon]
MKKFFAILQKSPKFEEFMKRNPEYDIISRNLTAGDMKRIQEEYPQINLFPHPYEDIIAITLISQVLMQNGYPKIKAYLDMKNKEILHMFVSN